PTGSAFIIPDIRKHFDNLDMGEHQFIKPAPGKEIAPLFKGTEDDSDSEIMNGIQLTLLPKTAIGFHRHRTKEKTYRIAAAAGIIRLL
ncbi:hypothetical protein NL351_28675, partial [Klebsiella pneumoniae]|nr:hypothetical protein [Klebsiella pneumoniae]